MSQSTKIIVSLFLAFIIFTTMKGHLKSYLQVMGLA